MPSSIKDVTGMAAGVENANTGSLSVADLTVGHWCICAQGAYFLEKGEKTAEEKRERKRGERSGRVA